MRYFFHIAYNGIRYHGWQRQPHVISIQEVLETHLEKLLKKPIVCIGCGRTDAQVHASQFFFHIDVDEELQEDFRFIFNKMLPDDIALFDLIKVQGRPHAQFDATSRVYDYFIHTEKDPFLSEFSSLYQVGEWDRESMQKAVAMLPNYQDFRGFCKTPDRHDHTFCYFTAAKLSFNPKGTKLHFQFEANGFLRGMIRMLVGSLVSIGEQKMALSEFERCLQNQTAPKYPRMAYPQGLYLSKVQYPFLDLPTRGKPPF